VLIFTACGTAASPSPAASAAGSQAASQPPASVEAYDGLQYPEDGSSACGTEGYQGQVGSIKAIDAKTVEFALCAPDAAFLSKIAFTSLAIQDADFLAETGGGGEALFRNPNGTGPYKLKAWTSGSEISLETFADFWGTKPLTPNAVIRWSPEAAQRLIELTGGVGADGIDNPGPDDFATIEANPDLKLYPRVALNVFYVGFNNNFKPFDNEKVRQAIAQGIDRKRIVDNFYPPGSEVASHFTPCDIAGGCSGDEWYA
jgi:ABC-type transport system substrate-binding protein